MNIELIPNSLTATPSYYAAVKPVKNVDFEDLVIAVVASNPLYTTDLVMSIAKLMMEEIRRELTEGNFVNLEGYMSFRTTLPGRVESISSPVLPDNLDIAINASVPYRDYIRNNANITKLPVTQKAPIVEWQQDTGTQREGFISSSGIMHIKGQHLKFPLEPNFGVKVYNTVEEVAYFSTVVGLNNDTQTLAMPVLHLDQASNEHRLSIVTRYTENGSSREGFYPHYLRSERRLLTTGDYPFGIFSGLISAI